MEFIRLADVDVVETANDTDKVLIEQNGEIKRVPKTEVGGSGGKMLVLEVVVDCDADTGEPSFAFTSNMTLEETVEAFNNRELTRAIAYAIAPGEGSFFEHLSLMDITEQIGFACFVIYAPLSGMALFWTADGLSMEEPTPAES